MLSNKAAESYASTVNATTVQATGLPQNSIIAIKIHSFFYHQTNWFGYTPRLSLINDIIESHCGEIKVESIQEEGMPAELTGTSFLINIRINKK